MERNHGNCWKAKSKGSESSWISSIFTNISGRWGLSGSTRNINLEMDIEGYSEAYN